MGNTLGKAVQIISRPDDVVSEVGEISDTLARQFGAGNVAIADTTAVGTPELKCRVLIVVIGPGWQREGEAGRTVEHIGCPVLRQIWHAQRNGIPVIPVLVRSAARLTRNELPVDLLCLARQSPIVANDSDWSEGLDALAKRVRDILSPARPGLLLLNLVLLLAFFAWLGSWLSEATGLGDAIQAYWSLPIAAQAALAAWGIVT